MIGVWLHATSRWCARAIVVLVALAIARISYIAWVQRGPTVALTPVVFDDKPKGNSVAFPFDVESLRSRLVPSIPSDLVPRETMAAAGNISRSSRSRIYLVVSVLPDRAELLINGVTFGRTPYVGEVSCQTGGKLTITVVPLKGMPKRFERLCDRREIRIDDSESGIERDQ